MKPTQKEIINLWIEFKQRCIDKDIIDLQEIKLVFEVWLTSC